MVDIRFLDVSNLVRKLDWPLSNPAYTSLINEYAIGLIFILISGVVSCFTIFERLNFFPILKDVFKDQ